MKNLLKSVMLITLIMPFFGCNSDSLEPELETVVNNSPEQSIVVDLESCENTFSNAKFVNHSLETTGFSIYNSENTLLSSELGLQPDASSEIKAFRLHGSSITYEIRTSDQVIRKPLSVKACMLYTFVIDEDNQIMVYMDELN